jgi:hypothetical protein
MALSVTHRLHRARTWKKPPHEDRPKDRPAAKSGEFASCEIATLAKDDWTSEPLTEADVSSALGKRYDWLKPWQFTSETIIHGHRRRGYQSPEYYSWAAMRNRCNNPSRPNYPDYGGRGVTVCERWNDFAAFLADMGPRPEGHSIDRIDNNENYEPGNCRWATPTEQSHNQRPRRRRRWQRKPSASDTRLLARTSSGPGAEHE